MSLSSALPHPSLQPNGSKSENDDSFSCHRLKGMRMRFKLLTEDRECDSAQNPGMNVAMLSCNPQDQG